MAETLGGRRPRGDAGTTLSELMVTMLVMSVVMAGLATLFIGALRTATSTQGRLEETSDGRIAVSSMGRTLRTAILPSQLYDSASTASAAFIQAESRAISFYANIDNVDNSVGPTRVRYWVDGAGVLYESKQVPDARTAGSTRFEYCTPGPGCTTVQQKPIARGVQGGTAPIFVYYDQLGNQLSGAALSATQMEQVDAIDIVLTVQRANVPGNGSTYTLRVALPNHDAVVQGED